MTGLISGSAGAAAADGRDAASVPDPVGTAPRRRRRPKASRVVSIALLVVVTIAFAYPFVWLVSASFKPRGEVFDNKLIPDTFTLENYAQVWQEAPLALWLVNTLVVTALAAVTVTISSSMVAWGFAYFRFRGRNVLFGLVLASMMLPGAVTMIPTFLIWNSLGFVGTLVPMWAQNLFASAFYVFLLRQFILTLPRELFEAARVDGASQWAVFWRIAVPLLRPTLAVVLVFEVQAAWTDLMRGLIYLRDSATFTIPRGLKSLVDAFGFGGEWHWEIIVTASVIATVPMIIVFFLAQKQIIRGISTSGLKG
ncbi:carbohydrate ABC transporter permease [Microbacterium sp. EYE_5]|uniref:carbohydrate ABC transporter permease n=1 Tax=unclassified Microbacterium TaxID=2609290 RepID=UPI002003CD23|nr:MULTISPECIES: carbohydrate ABC transporter permease [unclassified Microbacterium]MCK6081453.1 carbohydrate ABC transporter permease [Microbacterium sp. EYE_382]MCK6086723.1 carbohydrate ABC transporter permease [Microbacterium sp. EYE_384]MCK6123779.1 carbohydrate ABC transporter permease [Microbacterium sp. EYE_80]MCK6126688.1 carbohydrate ABC transporter permease [Microbacterium sp. EYE_79]MCK6142408.1 carbohydrate ABC transporter permease [Microbacterium sp. EYE_39]